MTTVTFSPAFTVNAAGLKAKFFIVIRAAPAFVEAGAGAEEAGLDVVDGDPPPELEQAVANDRAAIVASIRGMVRRR
ncbi:hypothetical protein [Streptomyces sp. NPDC058755]|uniref:hypothetical protein n=1 Tax=Streptomyces sp. NPDC058755 TaxID=3346624 RepID=UPI0036815207